MFFIIAFFANSPETSLGERLSIPVATGVAAALLGFILLDFVVKPYFMRPYLKIAFEKSIHGCHVETVASVVVELNRSAVGRVSLLG